MDDLVRWLGVQLDEDERIARAAGDRWRELSGNWVAVAVEPSSEPAHRVAMVLVAEGRAHIVRHDPARVLREIEAKRRALVLHSAPTGHGCSTTDETGYNLNYDEVSPEDACTTLRLLALPYADRPGFQESWRP